MNNHILILGKTGQLGKALLQQSGDDVTGFSRLECDFTDPDFIDAIDALHNETPLKALVNAAAYTHVDQAESEDAQTLLRINALAPGILAQWCVDHDVPLVHFSTDYVFGGKSLIPWQEADQPCPVNAYGRSKLAGERAILDAHPRSLIIRSSWLYDHSGSNFFTKMCALMAEKNTLRVVNDQIGAPTFVPHLAAASLRALESALRAPVFPTGVYHLCHSGQTSWHGFAETILHHLQEHGASIACNSIVPIASSEYKAAALRPENSRLDCRHIRDSLHVWLPSWEAGLQECFELHDCSAVK